MSHSGSPSPHEDFDAWLHRLRNEVNSAQMAAAAALMLLDAGQQQSARENLDRAASACRRSAKLLSGRPPREP